MKKARSFSVVAQPCCAKHTKERGSVAVFIGHVNLDSALRMRETQTINCSIEHEKEWVCSR